MQATERFHALSGLSLEDQHKVSLFGRGLKIDPPQRLIHEAFESIAAAHPSAIAAKCGHLNQTITYQQMDKAANRLSNHLIRLGLRPRQRVCLVVQRSVEMLVGIFAVLKAGCQYVPIDGGVTSEQALLHILADTDARFILCLPKLRDKVEQFAGPNALILTLSMDIAASCPATKPIIHVLPQDGAYAIYTSGSTGRPKGVDVSHGNVTNALLLEPARLGTTVGTKVAQVLSVGFDMGAWEILVCLMNGGTLILRGSDWRDTLSEVDTLISTPSILARYQRSSFPNIKCVVTGGEFCPQRLADEWAENAIFYNICGPTEISILNTAHRHEPGMPLSVGKPLPNTTCYILDDNEQPVPFGAKGFMWVGGAGVSKGYINLPELTSTRYKVDKFKNDGSKMFNTGDLASWNDGSVQMHGRGDAQVKIKGFRVELDGVVSVIGTYPGVKSATAFLVENVLTAFYEARTPIDEQDLDSFVRKILPYYSVPENWIEVPSMPLTPNGKVDRKELSAMTFNRSQSSSTLATKVVENTSAPAQVDAEADISKDPEKQVVLVETKASSLSSINISDTPETLPKKNGFHGMRWLRHRAFILYRRFFSIVICTNSAVACLLTFRFFREQKPMLAHLATATAANLCVAVLMRSEPVINVLFTVFCSVPTFVPLAIRRHCARIYHIGGIHSGCAVAAMTWFAIFTIAASAELAKPVESRRISLAPTILSYLVMLIFVAIGLTSYPTFRAKYHNVWEMTHRFGGWTCLLLLWIQTFLATKDLNPDVKPTTAWLHSPPIWLLSVATMAVIFPWLFLRKVAVRSEFLCNHAVRLWFEYATPVVGTSVRLAERPLADWHGFATITNPDGKGFSLIVSRAGDFTGRTIERTPKHIYVRGIPACGVLRIATLFKSIVLVATGSGIGPCLAVILAKKVPCRVVWTARDPEETYGKEIMDSVLSADPKAAIWNTRTQGRPNTSLLAYKMWKESGAEAVCVISNKKFSTKTVYDLEARGVPAFSAIFDS